MTMGSSMDAEGEGQNFEATVTETEHRPPSKREDQTDGNIALSVATFHQIISGHGQ
jgi:hypothetical protein